MIIAALTGSIGMGKTTTAAMFAECGAAVWDADKAVHRLYQQGGLAVAPVGAAFPAVILDNAVDRDRLAKAVLSDPEALKRLEAIVHPLVGQDRKAFIDQARLDQKPIVIVDVPLLFETGGDAFVDAVIVVSCPAEVQRERVLARPGMTESKFDLILARQTPDTEKRKRAHFVVETGLGLEAARAQVGDVYQELLVRSRKSMD